MDHTHGGRIDEMARICKRPPGSFIDFSSNLNIFQPEAPGEDWAKWRGEIIKYPEPQAGEVRERLAEIHGLNGAEILPTAGAIEALYLAARLFQGRRVAVLEPGFGDYHRAFVAAGAEVVQVTGGMGNVPADCKTVVLGNPNNPDGAFIPRAKLAEAKQQLLVDEAFIEFVPDGDRESLLNDLADNPGIIVVRSLTKSWRIPGLRLGFLATSNRAWMEQLRAMQPPWTVGPVTTAWARQYLTHEHRERMLARLAELPRIREEFRARLAAIPGITAHAGTANYFLVELGEGLDSTRLFDAMAREGFLVRVCDSFHGLRKGAFIRLAVRTEAENAAFAEVFARVVEKEGTAR